MGNSHTKNREIQIPLTNQDRGQTFASQFSLSHLLGNNHSGRSLISVTSNQSVSSASRPWSRISRRRWNDSTLSSPLDASKTAWPVAHKESIFLPEFPITTELLQKNYEIQEIIANGAFGKVYKVKKVCEGKEYALKALSKSQVISENAIRQVKEEARIQAAVGHHTFIASAGSRWQSKKKLYIVSEYIPGGELLALLDTYGKLPEDLVKVFVAEIAIALDFLHNAGVIYRDLKPENILLTSECHVQLIDFGLSKWLSLGARTHTLCGTLRYMGESNLPPIAHALAMYLKLNANATHAAPEVLSREPYGHAVDWWSLGVLVCRMLTNEFPITAADSTKMRENNKDQQDCKASPIKEFVSLNRQPPGTLPASASDLSKAARGLLLRLLDRDPRARMRNLRQLQQSAFYMGYNFELVKEKKISPKEIMTRCFPNGASQSLSNKQITITDSEVFSIFDQPVIV